MIPRLFLPDHYLAIYTILLVAGLVVLPLITYYICRCLKQRLLGLFSVALIWYVVLYGVFVGFRRLEVTHIDLSFPDLPEAFDGYRLLLFSDAHIGTFTDSWQQLLQRDIDSILSQKADMIVFTGDLQNVHPKEIEAQRQILSRLKAPDGVFSVLGNHDYASYLNVSQEEKDALCRRTIALEREMGWTLLLNEHRTVCRDSARLVIAGMENYSKTNRFPKRGDVRQALDGTQNDDFIVMLHHDPYAWRQQIVPDGRARLTLSGHTHAMQFMIGQWSPIALLSPEWNGLYREGQQQLFVTKGMGALIPWRFGATGEIVVITLHHSTSNHSN